MSPRNSSSAAHGHTPLPDRRGRERSDGPAGASPRLTILLLSAVFLCGTAHAVPTHFSSLSEPCGQSGLLPDSASLRAMIEMAESLGESGLLHGEGFPQLPGDTGNPGREKAWTLMFYDDADFYGAFDPFDDFCSEAASSPCLDVVVLRDVENGPAALWYVDPSHEPVMLLKLGELDMGDGATLSDFIVWAKQHYPADRYIMTMYDHGGGWWGACIDETSGGDLLYMEEIHQAISESGGLDILCFTAPCLMGALESVYELRDCVDVYIGSENVSGYQYWFDTIVDLCEALNSPDPLSNEDIASIVVQAVLDNAPPEYESFMTMSATDPEATEDLVAHIDELAVYMTAHIEELGAGVQTVRNSTWEMGSIYSGDLNEVDLIDFLVMYYAVETDPFVLGKIGEILSAFFPVVTCEVHGSGQSRSHGLSISFPEDRSVFQDYYTLLDLDFADDTSWDEFLNAFYDFQETGIQGSAGLGRIMLSVSPNPFTSAASIGFSCPTGGSVTMRVHDCAGRIVAVLFDGSLESGEHSLAWDGTGGDGQPLPSGIYVCTLDSGGLTATAEVLILR